jgi:tripartite-type tricarboxylate transporter receptor subunit TctC
VKIPAPSKVMLVSALLSGALVGQTLAQSTAYPSRPVRLLVPFTPGGGTDILARIVGAKMYESMGQQVVVDNRPGANTLIATEIVARAAPDGYTLILQTNILAANPTLYRGKMTFDTL